MAEGAAFKSCGELFAIDRAFDHGPEIDRLFNSAMAEALRWHRAKCLPFANFLRVKGYTGGDKRFEGQFLPELIPPLFVTIFKERRLISIPEDKIAIELTSSGTGGQKSAIFLDRRSLKRILTIVDHIFGSLGLVDRTEKVNYLCFTYDPRIAKNVGTAFSDKILTGLTARKTVFYAIRWKKDTATFEFDLDLTVKRLLAFGESPDPVRILGFPAHLWRVCEQLETMGKKLNLGQRSFVLTGGGWKVDKNREVTKEVFKTVVAKRLGIPPENIRDTFGMVEHGIPYVDCEHGRLHVPIYSRARIIDPETLKPLAFGEPGLLHLMTPYLSSYPSTSLLTTDRATLEPDCPCGRPGGTIRILGRAGLAKHKGCAITALELLQTPAA
ncbi:MAG: acyl-protein synthetase [Candidatus Riflebacteria bacterium]|nr:acyl-protein synthetase [Candidatus Riflebacteria bacterium]